MQNLTWENKRSKLKWEGNGLQELCKIAVKGFPLKSVTIFTIFYQIEMAEESVFVGTKFVG